jgi:hypothetical protein
MAARNGLDTYPRSVAELGPGDSLGIGLAALISGCESYSALDVVGYADPGRNLEVFDRLVTLFEKREDIPDEKEFPRLKPYLEDYRFPAGVMDGERLRRGLDPARLGRIRESLGRVGEQGSMIRYRAPWFDSRIVEKGSVDMIYSQAVLEHVDDLRGTYRAMRMWLKPHGYLSHQIDFKSHGTSSEWNGHWAYSDRMWKLIRGRRPYLLNRQPHSVHLAIMEEEGFEVVCDQTVSSESRISRDRLAPGFRNMTERDLTTSGAFIQAAARAVP